MNKDIVFGFSVFVVSGIIITSLLSPDLKDAELPAPQEPIDSKVQALLKGSDDFDSNGEEFVTASVGLVNSGTCTLKDFVEGSGWIRSTSKGEGIYFLYCGNHLHRSGRLYLNAKTGKVFR